MIIFPEDSAVVIPRLVGRDPAAAIDFCARSFGAVELNRRPGPDGTIAHALMTESCASARWKQIFVYVEDVDQTIERAVGNGMCGLWQLESRRQRRRSERIAGLPFSLVGEGLMDSPASSL
jgi:PhnB protein